MPAQRIAVVGAGAWGTALANVIARVGRRVTLWARNPAIAAAIVATRESPRLPGVRIDDRVTLAALSDGGPAGDAILVVVPAQALRAAVSALADVVAPGTPVVACAKGIERGTGRFMTEIIAECLPAAIPAILSGPSFAGDVARGPTLAHAMTKKMLHQEWSLTVDAAIESEAQAQAECMQTQDFQRAYRAFAAKQRPEFKGD